VRLFLVGSSSKVDHLATGEGRPERYVARHVRQPAVQRRDVPPGIAAEHPDRAAVRPQQAEQHPQGRGLSGPVRAQEAMHLAGAHLQIEAVEGPGAPEGLDQARAVDGQVGDGRAVDGRGVDGRLHDCDATLLPWNVGLPARRAERHPGKACSSSGAAGTEA
jgi:hypothetical protein